MEEIGLLPEMNVRPVYQSPKQFFVLVEGELQGHDSCYYLNSF